VLLHCLSLVGCFPITELQTPSTLAPGASQIVVAIGAGAGGIHRYDDGIYRNIPIDVAGRFGIVKNFEARFQGSSDGGGTSSQIPADARWYRALDRGFGVRGVGLGRSGR
jgi:hypothetical protein